MTRADLERELVDVSQAIREQSKALSMSAVFAGRQYPKSVFPSTMTDTAKRLLEIALRLDTAAKAGGP